MKNDDRKNSNYTKPKRLYTFNKRVKLPNGTTLQAVTFLKQNHRVYVVDVNLETYLMLKDEMPPGSQLVHTTRSWRDVEFFLAKCLMAGEVVWV